MLPSLAPQLARLTLPDSPPHPLGASHHSPAHTLQLRSPGRSTWLCRHCGCHLLGHSRVPGWDSTPNRADVSLELPSMLPWVPPAGGSLVPNQFPLPSARLGLF